ncbi:hypothetical protein H310_07179 [Aphanomyces invadans]|uniref:DUF4476 domain-containing protein n=1 Tax=Aphanomyces invadans TaxID=157072 RepID=A0A024U3X4_9STRA|nr:hypothetical protein H310_07179 [Aphanomyces invadans]ETW00607.1 hypothetical protein H310_07179 [Aphanomyces invadans]|eukprot:XP_008870742.1 hypothetical protein H310_07179 [Aphanomyces invadans]
MKRAATPHRPTTTLTSRPRARDASVLPNLKLNIAHASIQKEINILLDVDPTSDETFQTTLQLTKQPSTASGSIHTSQRIPVSLPSPHRYTPRAETRQAIKTFHHLFVAEPERQRRQPSSSAGPLDLELDDDNDSPALSTKATISNEDERYMTKVANLITDSAGKQIAIPKTPRHNGWSIKDVKNNYGWGGKVRFMAQVRKNRHEVDPPAAQGDSRPSVKVDAADMEHVNVDNMLCSEKYIDMCLKMELTPEPLIIPKHEACGIDLSYYGTGSKPMDALSSCLGSIPKLQTLVVKENRLTDTAIVNILQSSDFTRLLTLNLSKNRIRQRSTRALHTFLNQNRVVQTLVLSDCDLHSDFIKCIEEPLAKNPSLTVLDMSKNKLDDFCATALATICKDNSNLTMLDLSWNSFRSKGAAGLAEALQQNQCLQTLLLSWNGIGHGDGANCLAHALRDNAYLQKLDLTGNSIMTEATLALTNMWAESTVLEILILDQNPIGSEGLRSIFRAYSNPAAKTHGRVIQFDACTLHHNDPVFDPNLCSGSYTIDMDNVKTFWRALEILRLANLYPSACDLDNVVHTTPLEAKHLSLHRIVVTTENVAHDGMPGPGAPTIAQLLALSTQTTPWHVPISGTISFDFKYNTKAHHPADVDPDSVTVFWDSYSALEFDSDRVKYIKMYLSDHYVTASQARHFLTTVTAIDSHADLVQLLLQKVSDTENLLAWASKPLLPTKHQSFLNECAGKLLYFDGTMPNGAYSLDLSSSIDQRIASQLFRISGDDKLYNKQNDGANTSQTGNWECFRNETLDGERYTFHRSFGLPEKGLFEFDFVVTSRLPRATPAISPELFEKVCHQASCQWCPTDISSGHHDVALNRAQSTKQTPTFSVNVATAAGNKREYDARRAEMKRFFGLGQVGVTATQVIELAECFHDVDQGRVDCVVTMLNHVLDLGELFPRLRTTWTPSEVTSLVQRVGWLNIWNPAYAEMEYTLNLTVWEDHQMAVILAQLGDIEPGENWVDETYNNIFGWELPLSWVQGKIPHAGRLYLRYTTGPNHKYRVVSAREELKKRTLCGKMSVVEALPPNTKQIDMRPPTKMRRKSIHQAAL